MGQDTVGRQARCELWAIGNTGSSSAIQLIRSACNWLALKGDFLQNANNKQCYVCLIQNLSGVQADEAADATGRRAGARMRER